MQEVVHIIAQRLRDAAERGEAQRIRGGGSKDFYGHQLRGRVLDTRSLGGIQSYEPAELVITAGAGTPLAHVEATLAEHGQYLAFEPPNHNRAATLGGAVAAGLSGPARASVGALRDFVLGVQVINGRGEILNFGGQVMKNVAGYDVSRLMAGSMGTLGVITSVSLKVSPQPPAECTLAFQLSETSARQQLNRWGGRPLPLDASCWVDGFLVVRLRGAHAAIDAACQAMGGQVVDAGHARQQWQALRSQALPFFQCPQGHALWCVDVPDTAPPLNLGPTLVEWHGARRWVRQPLAEYARVRAAAHRLGGQATLFRGGDGVVPLFDALSAPLMQIHTRLKQAFDPAGILNPGRLHFAT